MARFPIRLVAGRKIGILEDDNKTCLIFSPVTEYLDIEQWPLNELLNLGWLLMREPVMWDGDPASVIHIVEHARELWEAKSTDIYMRYE
jgi:hypothetical protein